MDYLQDIQEAKDLLDNPRATYEQLLDKLCDLERSYGELKKLIKMGFNEDIVTLWKIGAIANKIKLKIKIRVRQLAKKLNRPKPKITPGKGGLLKRDNSSASEPPKL